MIHRGALPTRAEVDAYAAGVFTLIDRLLTELGAGAAHAELVQEQTFAAHVRGLPDGVTVVFEEHPGMFRARRFGTLSPIPKPAKAQLQAAQSASGVNDARAFQQALFEQALAERGSLLRGFKSSS